MVIFNRYKIVTAGFEKASKKLIHTGLREIGSFTSLSAQPKGKIKQSTVNQMITVLFLFQQLAKKSEFKHLKPAK